MKKSLYKRFYTKTPNSATFDVENGHHSPFSCHSKFRLAIPLYFLSLYNGGIDAQNTHFQSNKSLNELHFLKYSSIFSFWAKIKDRQFYNQRSNRSMELKSSFFPSEMILSFFSLYNANDNIILRQETLPPTEMFNSY